VTIAAFSPKADPKQPLPPSVKMWREPLSEGSTLRQHANRMIVQLARELTGFDLMDNEDVVVAERPAVRLRCKFKSRWGPVEQTRVMVDPASDPEPMVTVFFLASRPEDAKKSREILDEVLKTVKFESKQGGPVRRGAADPSAAAHGRPLPVPPGPGGSPGWVQVHADQVQGPPAPPMMVPPPTFGAPPEPAAPDNPSFMPPSMPMPGRQR
jgi:hypothetical protein